MTASTPDQIRNVYERWHEGFGANDLKSIMDLYAEHAVIESPTVMVLYPDSSEGVLRGRSEIEKLFGKVLQNVSSEFKELYRSQLYLADGNLLMWEYPRQTPGGEQIDLVESMDLEDGKIVYHRVYWGWKGFKALTDSVSKRSRAP